MKLTSFLAVFLLLVLTFITFSSSLQNDFVNWDDELFVTENIAIRSLTLNNLSKVFSDLSFGMYLPFTMISYMLDYHFWGDNPFGYHLTSLIIHMFNVVLVYFFLRALGLQAPVSLIATSIFAIHPVQVESVAWVSERKHVLAFLFFFLSFLTYIRYSKTRSLLLYLLSVMFFVAASFSKSAVVVLPILLLAYDYFYGREIKIGNIKDKVLYFIIAAVASALTIYGHASHWVGIHIHGGTIPSHVISIFAMFTEYLRLVFYPLNLSAIYEVPVYTSVFHLKPLVGIAFVGLAVFFFCRFFITRDKRGYWIIWFFILMLPVIHIIPFFETYNDRYLYVTILSFPILLYSVLEPRLVTSAWRRHLSVAGVVIIVIALSILSYERCKVWNNSFGFWQDVLKSAPNSSKPHMCLGVVYMREGALDKGIEEELCAIELDPRNARAYNNLGVCYSEKGLYGKAVQAYSNAIVLYPDYDKAYSNLSAVYFRQRAWDMALEAAKKSIVIEPDSADAYNNLGNAYAKKGMYNEALDAYKRALTIDPESESAKKNMQTLTEFIETQNKNTIRR